MILNNYWNYKTYMDKTGTSWYTGTGFVPGLYNMSGQTEQIVLGPNQRGTIDNFYPVVENRATRMKLVGYVGSSATTPTGTDYALSTDITSSFSNVQLTTSVSSDGDLERTTFVLTGDNATGSAITIREIGIAKLMHIAFPYEGEEYLSPFLMIHHVLQDPEVIPAGEGFTIPYEWIES